VNGLQEAAEESPLLTAAEVGALFRVDPETVRRWGRRKKLTEITTPGGRHKRFRADEVEALLEVPGDGAKGNGS
jgi:excisionase family DNA binding protein